MLFVGAKDLPTPVLPQDRGKRSKTGKNIYADQSTTDRKSVVISTRGDARSTGVEALSTSIHSLFAYDPAIAPMIIPDQMPRLSAPAGFIYNVETVLAEGGQSSLARL